MNVLGAANVFFGGTPVNAVGASGSMRGEAAPTRSLAAAAAPKHASGNGDARRR